MKKVGVSLLAFIFLFTAWALPVRAADTAKEVDQLKGEVKNLLKKIEDLERKQKEDEQKFETVEKAATKLEQEEVKLKEEKKQKALAYWKDGFFIETPDKQFRLQIGGQIHFDTRVFAGETKTPTSFDLRRARYDMRGSMYTGDLENAFRLQVEMADSPLVQNAYWIFKFRPEFNLMVGQFKPPVNSSDRLTEEGQLNFVEYAVDVPLTGYYDRGINIISKFLDGKVQTCVGAIDGVGSDNDNTQGDLDNNKNYFVRLLLNPFKDTDVPALQKLYFVGSFEDGLQSIKTARGETNFRTENYESQWFTWNQSNVRIHDRERYGAEVHWIMDALSASYEFNRVQWNDISVFNSNRSKFFNMPGDHHVDVQQVWVSYFLTGEHKTYEDVFYAWRQPKPNKNFSLKDGTWGAWEVIARYKRLDASDDLFAQHVKGNSSSVILQGVQEGHALTGGLRWTWNPKVRLMLDANYLKSDDGKGIVTQSSYITANDTKTFKKEETAFLLRFILQL